MYGPYPVPPPAVPGPPPAVAQGFAAARGRRFAAWSIDATALAVVAFFLGVMTWGRLNGILNDGLWDQVLSGIWGLLLSGGDIEAAAENFGMSIWHSVVGAIEQALILLVLVEFLHQFAGQALAGRTLGKTVLDLRVGNVQPAMKVKPAVSRVLRRAALTTAGGTGLYCVAWILLLHGMFFVAVLAWMTAVSVFVANSVPALFGARRTLADRAAGTVVVPAHTYRRAAEFARQGAGRAWAGTQAAGYAVRDQAARLATEDRMRQAQDLGRRSAAKMRDAAQGERARQAQDVGKRLGGRIKGAYTDRKSAQRPPEPPPGQPPAIEPPLPDYGPVVQPDQQRPAQHWAPDPYRPPDPPSGGNG
ncbi:hypothetical protein GCM10022254_07430 [Actinomadura meridiana]|uniref:RDD domain-containing protein n=1 Tax=Actinomadura meridiana TaxID=559626 RepID=A0ABP8BT59_9ACTN